MNEKASITDEKKKPSDELKEKRDKYVEEYLKDVVPISKYINDNFEKVKIKKDGSD